MQSHHQINFTDYLQLEFSRRKSLNAKYSLRSFARDLKVTPSRLSELFSAKKGISKNKALSICDQLKISSSEKDYVKKIAVLEFSKTLVEKQKAEKEIKDVLNKNSKVVDAEEFLDLSDWYYLAILETLSHQPIKSDYRKLSHLINLDINTCKMAIDRLIRKKYVIVKLGFWFSTYKKIHIAAKNHAVIKKLHQQILERGIQSFENSESEQREFNSAFVSLTDKEMTHFKKKLTDFSLNIDQEIKTLRDNDSKKNKADLKLYSLNSQLFPIGKKNQLLSKKAIEEKKLIHGNANGQLRGLLT